MAKPKIPVAKTDPWRVTYIPDKDLYKRAVGNEPGKKDKKGRPVPAVFILTSDEHESRERAYKLFQLWRSLVAKGCTEWTPEALEVAEAIRTGQHRLELEPSDYCGGGIGIDGFYPYDRSEEIDRWRVETRANPVIPVVVLPSPVGVRPPATGQNLYDAIDDYADHIRTTMKAKTERVEDSKTSEWGENFAKSVLRLKDSVGDMPLPSFGLAQIESVVTYWKHRPYRKRSTKRISVETVFDQVSSLRRFIKWCHRSPHWQWRKPADLDLEDDVFRLRRKDLMTPRELSEKAKGPPTFDLGELTTLWKYATQWERLFLVLGLNCAFAEAETSGLVAGEVYLDGSLPKIKRVRVKSGVYGEFALWPETVAALRWATSRSGASGPHDHVIVSEKGKRMRRSRIVSVWRSLYDRVRKDYPNFKFLPFKFLRKTAGQMVQDLSDGETSGVFQCRGKRVETDELSDRYTRRDFRKVFEANARVRQHLQPMFDAGPAEPFSGDKKQGGNNISLGTIDRIKDLDRQGMKPDEIIRTVGVSRATVYRHISPRKPRKPRSDRKAPAALGAAQDPA